MVRYTKLAVSLLLITVACGVAASPTAAGAASPIPPPSGELQEVRTTWTAEFAIDRPAGVTYEPRRDELLVAQESASGTRVLRLDPGGDPEGLFTMPSVTDVATLAFDATVGKLAVVDGDDVVVAAVPTRGAAAGEVVEGAATDLADARGATFDSSTGTWFVLDAAEHEIVVAVEGAEATAAPSIIDLGHLADRPLAGIAFNPADRLLYVGSPTEDLLYAVDATGTVATSYSLAGLDLRDPRAFTFAPSADSTDDPATQHLYIADAGDTQQLGGVIEATLAVESDLVAAAAVTDTGTLVQTIHTSQWSPASPDPSGVTYIPSLDRLMVVDSEVEETTGAGYHGVNLWQSTRTGTVTDTGTTFPAVSREPNGLGYIAATNTLLISDDSLRRVHLMRPGPDSRFGTSDDIVTFIDAAAYGSDDTEDPTYDPVSGHIFFLDGVDTQVFRINPVDGIFGNGNDTMSQFDVGQYGISDTEALVYYPPNDSLIVGNRTGRELIEVTKTGTLLRTIDLSGIPGLSLVSGMTVAPASNGTGALNYWVVDRAQDNGPNPNENDGKLFEIAAGPNDNTAPVVDSVVINQTAPTTNATLSATVTAHDDDGDALTYLYQWRKNGVSLPGQTGPTLDLSVAGNGDKGDAISLRVNAFDGVVQSAPRTSAQVTIVNSSPVFGQNLGNRTDTEGAVVAFSAGATDADGDALTYGASNLPSGVSVNASTGAVSGTIAAGAAAGSPYSSAITVTDGTAPAATDTFTWTVEAAPPTNTAPVVDSVVIDQAAPRTNDVLTATVTAHDIDGDPLTFTYQWTRNGTNISDATGSTLDLSGAGHGNKGDQIALRVVASDGDLPSAPVTSAAVTIVNSEPVFAQDLGNRTDTEGAVILVSAGATDADGDALTYGITNAPGGIAVNPSTGTVSGTIAAGASAGSPYSTVVTVGDGPLVDASDSFTWTVNAPPPTNVAPVVDSVIIDQPAPATNDVLSVTVSAHDDNNDPLTYTYQWRRNGSDIAGATGSTLDLAVAGHGSKGDTITVRVIASDGALASAPVTSAGVTIVDTPPAFAQNLGDRTDAEGSAVSFSAGAIDADGDALTYEITNAPAGVTIDASSGAVSGTIAVGASAGSPYTTIVSVRDGTLADATDSFVWTVTAAPVPPVVLPGSATTVEGDAGTHVVQVPVALSAASASVVTVEWLTLNVPGFASGAVSPSDYVAASGTVTFEPGQTAKTVALTINGDLVHEPDELAVVSFRNPSGATIGGFLGLGFAGITNDDPRPKVVPGGVAILEGNSGTRVAQVPVTLDRPSASTVTASYSTMVVTGLANQATAGSDYVATTGTVTFAPGETAKTVPVTIVGDGTVEPDELVVVAFNNPMGATMGGFFGLGLVSITNDD